MTATTHRAIRDFTARLIVGALVLGALILMGVGITRTAQPIGPIVDSGQ